jgi:RNase P/RNase MRP subunit p29
MAEEWSSVTSAMTRTMTGVIARVRYGHETGIGTECDDVASISTRTIGIEGLVIEELVNCRVGRPRTRGRVVLIRVLADG